MQNISSKALFNTKNVFYLFESKIISVQKIFLKIFIFYNPAKTPLFNRPWWDIKCIFMYFFIGFFISLSFVSVFHVLNDFVLMFFFQTLYQDVFCLPKPTPLTVRAKIVVSPSNNVEFYLGAVRVITIIFITKIIIIIIIITTISMIISLDLLTGSNKLVGNLGVINWWGTRGW